MRLPGAPPPKPIPLKERAALVFVERARLDVIDGAFVAIDAEGHRTHIPIGGVACLMLEPGARISHAAVSLAARAGTLVVWIGEAGVRLYAAGQPGGARSDKLLWQASLALDPADLRAADPGCRRRVLAVLAMGAGGFLTGFGAGHLTAAVKPYKGLIFLHRRGAEP